jgi:hypothetical protein
MKTPSPLARLDNIRGGDNLEYLLDDLEDDEYDDDEYEYYEVEDETEEEEPSSLSELPEVQTDKPSKRRVLPIRRLALPKSISIRSIGTSMPNLSTLQRNLISNSQNLSMEVVKFLSVHAYASASIGAGALCLLLVQIVLTRTALFPGLKSSGRRRKSLNKKQKKKKYGDYSKGYPDDEDVVDLDEAKKVGFIKRYWKKATDILVPDSLVYWFQNVGMSVGDMKSRMGMKLASVASYVWRKPSITAGEELLKDIDDTSRHAKVEAEFSTPKSFATEQNASLKETEKVDELKQQLETLTDSHQSLEQEYEASLRMLHEARLELRQLKSSQSNNDEDSQKEEMEATVKALETKYRQQMKEQIERIKNQTTEKIRAELIAEYDEKLQAQSELADAEKKKYEKEFLSSPAFQQYLDEASAMKIEEAVANAVEETIEQQEAKSREEMARVRDAIQKVLERERRMMKEQVAKATSQVREWVKKQQLEQLQRREEQLRGEARQLGLLEEEQTRDIEVDAYGEDEDVAMAGDVVDRRMSGRRQSSRRGASQERERYTETSLYDERRRGVEERRRSSRDQRGNYYPKQANDYTEGEDGYVTDNDDGTAGEVEDDIDRQRPPQRTRQSPRYTSTNIYKEAARRKEQQRRRDQGM